MGVPRVAKRLKNSSLADCHVNAVTCEKDRNSHGDGDLQDVPGERCLRARSCGEGEAESAHAGPTSVQVRANMKEATYER